MAAEHLLNDGDMPPLFREADKLAVKAQQRFFSLLRAELIFLALSAAVGILSLIPALQGEYTIEGITLEGDVTTLILTAVLIAIALLFRLIRIVRRHETRWYEARAVAESAKSLVWRYAVGGRPFEVTKDRETVEAIARKQFGDLATDVSASLQNILPKGDSPITQGMQTLRGQPFAIRREAYRVGRVEDQLNWYESRRQQNHSQGVITQWVLALLEVIGIVTAVLQAVSIVALNLQSVVSAVASAGIAWTQAKRYQDLSASYRVTAKEVAAIAQRIPPEAGTTEVAWSRFVEDAEGAFSREHQLWRAASADE